MKHLKVLARLLIIALVVLIITTLGITIYSNITYDGLAVSEIPNWARSFMLGGR